MRRISKSEAEEDFARLMSAAQSEPILIEQPGKDVVIVAADEFDEAHRLLHRKKMRALQRTRLAAAAEAKANGFSESMLPDVLERR